MKKKDIIDFQNVTFSNGNKANLLMVPIGINNLALLKGLELPQISALIILNGGTSGISVNIEKKLSGLFLSLAEFVIDYKIAVITGGTNQGVFSIFGKSLEKIDGASAPCIGFAPEGCVRFEDLEPHHTHFVLVEGKRWGNETETMYSFASSLAENTPTIALFAGGGKISIEEMLKNVEQKREMVLIGGSGRATNAVSKARSGKPDKSDKINKIACDGYIRVFDINQSPEELVNIVRTLLFPT